MITEKTVLILGAGASKPYGFPTGRELLYRIRTALNPEGASGFRTKLIEQDIEDSQINDFHKELIYSDPSSVDAFLEYRPEFLPVGKLAITLGLIPYENDDTLFKRALNKPSWYQYLFEKLNVPSFNKFINNNLSIITFNYDRSIEHYFFTVLKGRSNKSEKECATILGAIPVIHVHGRLGALPWQEESGRPYDSRDFRNVKEVSEQIKVIRKDIDKSSEFEEVYDLYLSFAERIIFLGFGYHEANLRRLRIGDLKGKLMMGTCYGLGKSDILAIRKKWNIILTEPNLKIIDFLRDAEPLS